MRVRRVTELWCARALVPDSAGVERWRESVRVVVHADGTVAEVETDAAPASDARQLGGWVLPGMPNVHGHAFQRALVGRTERQSEEAGSSFWTWRQEMYGLAERMTLAQIRATAALLYAEALEAGYVRMGEFQYLHHQPDGRPYAPTGAVSEALLEAADLASMPLCLLPVAYFKAGFGVPPLAEQRRFVHRDEADYLRLFQTLSHCVVSPHTLGFAPHSLRAVPIEWLGGLLEGVRDHAGLEVPIHVHVAEQRAEVEACEQAFGRPPVRLLLDRFDLDARWCLVHATHMDRDEQAEVAVSRAVVGLCPTTEANLGDGRFPLPRFLNEGGRFGVGSDSHVTVDPAEELRWLEYQARLAAEARSVLPGREGSARLSDLWGRAIEGGASVLGAPKPGLTKGDRADLIELDPDHPRLYFARSPEEVLDAYLLGSAPGMVRRVCIGGRVVVEDGHHVRRQAILQAVRESFGGLGGSA